MLRPLAFAGALLCACSPAMAGGFWDDVFAPAPSPVHHYAGVGKKVRPARGHHARVSWARGAAVAHRDFQASYGPRPAAWCGWFMTRLTGLHDRALWLARNWAHVGEPSAARPGAVVVWPHHVGRVEAVSGGRILVLSGNDGHRVRTRWRSMRGVIAFRRV
ncbi:hypothetical protein M2322_003531 [Rhodoblastus acidophilus]|nr:hypothetical protein [Rhodoblastus acidophilus]